ncbi:MAG: creatininase family protein [Armatimonadota bacterium]|nr:creatininase family protein [Armatimonadota bacterium]MDR5697273.1 creatininase family protein [Armatimonadota bacterium]
MADTVLLEEMTWPEIQQAVARGVRTVVIMTASTEQHGPHLPLATDALIGQAVGERVARRLGALLAPVIRPGCSDHHLAFPGSLSVPTGVFSDLVASYVRSLVPHGFRTFVLLSSHGGNFRPLQEAADRLRREFGPDGARILAVAGDVGLHDMMRVMVDAAASLGAPQDVDAIHADACETSVMMALRPDLVRTDRIEPGFTGRIDVDTLFRDGLRAVTPNGILGDPRAASPQLGLGVLDRLVDHLVQAVEAQQESRGLDLRRGTQGRRVDSDTGAREERGSEEL